MSRRFRFVGALSITALMLAACGGGGDSSGRTKNSALCYATQEEKDDAIKAAQDAFDAVMGSVVSGNETEESTTTVPEETTTTLPVLTASTVVLEEAGGGYRRPAVQISSDGDTSTTVEEQSEGGSLTPEQQAQLDLDTAASQPLCGEESQAVEHLCNITFEFVTTASGTSDCEEVTIEIYDGNGSTEINWEAFAGEQLVAAGVWNAIESPTLVVPFAYTPESVSSEEEISESSNERCSVIFTKIGLSWNCPNGRLFNVGIEVLSNQGVYPSVQCASSGSLSVPEGEPFWFNMHLVNGTQTILDGPNTERPLDEPIYFDVMADIYEVCSEYIPADDEAAIDWEAMQFSGETSNQTKNYSMTVPAGMESPVMIRLQSQSGFWAEFDFSGMDSECWGESCELNIVEFEQNVDPGTYGFRVGGGESTQRWYSNVEIQPTFVQFPELPFQYRTDGSLTEFRFTLDTPQTVILAATSSQTCEHWEDNSEENGFADPEITLRGPESLEWDDDNSGRGLGNCSASLIYEDQELSPGQYVVEVEDDDLEGIDVILSSSVELQQSTATWNYTTVSLEGDASISFEIPAGGAWFSAETITNQQYSVTWSYPYEGGDPIEESGCISPDGEPSTNDFNCVETYIEVGSDAFDWFQESLNFENYVSEIVGNEEIESINNVGGSRILVWFPEGMYELFTGAQIQRGNNEGDPGRFDLRYGFKTVEWLNNDEIIPTIPEIISESHAPTQTALPTNVLQADSVVSVALAPAVSEFACDSYCISELFANAGMSDGTILVSIGSDPVLMRKGQRKAVIPVDKNAGEISAVVTSADGSKVVELRSGITKLPADIQAAIDSKTVVGINGSTGSSKLPYLIGLIVVLIAAGAVIRRKQATQNV